MAGVEVKVVIILLNSVKSSSSWGGILAPGLNVGTRIKGTVLFTFLRGRELIILSEIPTVCHVLRWAE